mmetsp:Transcript_10527/g.26698  ORF Transcript_10527/g.26698 Transcript_10527/m.26698 type:complete len:164 (+) Transcript_10527:94-585(+)
MFFFASFSSGNGSRFRFHSAPLLMLLPVLYGLFQQGFHFEDENGVLILDELGGTPLSRAIAVTLGTAVVMAAVFFTIKHSFPVSLHLSIEASKQLADPLPLLVQCQIGSVLGPCWRLLSFVPDPLRPKHRWEERDPTRRAVRRGRGGAAEDEDANLCRRGRPE